MSGTRHRTHLPGFRFVVVVGSLGGLPVLRTLAAGHHGGPGRDLRHDELRRAA